MAVEFYDIDEQGLRTLLFQLCDKEFDILDPVLMNFKKLTGLTIDQYGTTRIAFDHVKLLNELIYEHTETNRINADKLNNVKLKLGTVRSDLVAIGD